MSTSSSMHFSEDKQIPPDFNDQNSIEGSPEEGNLLGRSITPQSGTSSPLNKSLATKLLEKPESQSSSSITNKKIRQSAGEEKLKSIHPPTAETISKDKATVKHASINPEEWVNNCVFKKSKDVRLNEAQRAALKEDLGFMIDDKKVPFRGAMTRYSDEQIQRLSELHPESTWVEAFKNRREFLKNQMAEYEPIIKNDRALCQSQDPRKGLYQIADDLSNTDSSKKEFKMSKAGAGCGGAHFCVNSAGERVAVVKSVNGDVGSIDNSNGFAHPFENTGAKPVQNYESVQKEALAYELSLVFGCEGSVPPTILCIVETPEMYTFFDHDSIQNSFKLCPREVKEKAIELLGGPAASNRLCCIQEAVKDASDLNKVIIKWDPKGGAKFNQESYEKTIHLTRILGETDGHTDNYLAVEKNKEYHLFKIDSGFSLPQESKQALNSLTSLPNAQENISESYKEKILNTDPEKFETLASKYKLDQKEIDHAKERINFMKTLVQTHPHINHREFELRLRLFSGQGYETEIAEQFISEKRNSLKEEGHSDQEVNELFWNQIINKASNQEKTVDEMEVLVQNYLASLSPENKEKIGSSTEDHPSFPFQEKLNEKKKNLSSTAPPLADKGYAAGLQAPDSDDEEQSVKKKNLSSTAPPLADKGYAAGLQAPDSDDEEQNVKKKNLSSTAPPLADKGYAAGLQAPDSDDEEQNVKKKNLSSTAPPLADKGYAAGLRASNSDDEEQMVKKKNLSSTAPPLGDKGYAAGLQASDSEDEGGDEKKIALNRSASSPRHTFLSSNSEKVNQAMDKVLITLITNPEINTYETKSAFALKNYNRKELKMLKKSNREKFPASDSEEALLQVKAGGLHQMGKPWKGSKKGNRSPTVQSNTSPSQINTESHIHKTSKTTPSYFQELDEQNL